MLSYKYRVAAVFSSCLLLFTNAQFFPPPPPPPPPPTEPSPPPSPTEPPPTDASTTTESTCPISCECFSGATVICNGNEADPTVATMSFYNMELTEVPVFIGVYPEIRAIDLRRNFIESVSRQQITSLNFPNLEVLLLSENSITSLDREAFQLPSLQVLDLSSNLLDFFDLAVIRNTGTNFNTLVLTNNNIADFLGARLPFFTRDRYPSLTIFLGDNPIHCNAGYLDILCHGYLARNNAECIVDYDTYGYDIYDYGTSTDYSTMLLSSVCDACCQSTQAPTNGNPTGSGSNSTAPMTAPGALVNTTLITSSTLGTLLGVVLIILITSVCVFYCRFKIQKKRQSALECEAHTVITVPPQPVISPDLTLKDTQSKIPYPPRYIHQPHLLPSSDGSPGVNNGENIYEVIGARPLPLLPNEVEYEPPLHTLREYEPPLRTLRDDVDYEPSGYILRVDSIPERPLFVKQTAVEIEPITEEEEPQPSKVESKVESKIESKVESKDAGSALAACDGSGVDSQVDCKKKPGTDTIEQEVAYIKVVL